MVKIRFPRNSTMAQRSVIQIAIDKTSMKFDNNIVANRFEQTTITTHEVTIKCVSSRGKGAKRGAAGRRTTSCCWHAWGTFFDELFRLNPSIVIVAMGHRITATEGNWVDGFTGGVGQQTHSTACDCETNGWVREEVPYTPTVTRVVIPDHEEAATPPRQCDASCRHSSANNDGVCCTRNCGHGLTMWEPLPISCSHCRYSSEHYGRCPVGDECMRSPMYSLFVRWVPPAPDPVEERVCNATCRHSRSNNGGTPCVRSCQGAGNPGWEPYVATDIRRECSTCRYSHRNTSNGASQCPPGRCLSEEGQQNWEPIETPPLPNDPTPNSERRCYDCRHSNHHAGYCCAQADGNNCLIDNEHRLYERYVEPTHTVRKSCDTCKFSVVNGHKNCYLTVGRCTDYVKWQPLVDNEGFDPTPYLQQPTVMPEEKGYMDFEGVI
jgi:hypothetical protein